MVSLLAGPFDFQVHEPVHSLFAAMPNTSLIIELEVTQEYLGQGRHLCHLPAQWQSYMRFDFTSGNQSTVGAIVGSQPNAGVAGVSNFGEGRYWTGHPLAAANSFVFGRLAWSPNSMPSCCRTDSLHFTCRCGSPPQQA